MFSIVRRFRDGRLLRGGESGLRDFYLLGYIFINREYRGFDRDLEFLLS